MPVTYPNSLRDMVVVGYRSPTARSFNVIPSKPGEYVLTIEPRARIAIPNVNLKLEFTLAFPPDTVNGPKPQLREFDLQTSFEGLTDDHRRQYKIAFGFWKWSLRSSRPLVMGMFSRRTRVARGEFGLSTTAPPNWLFWSCNQPYKNRGLCCSSRATVNSESKQIFRWYGRLVEKNEPNMVFGLGDTAYADGVSSTDLVSELEEDMTWAETEEGKEMARNAYRRMYAHSWSWAGFSRSLGNTAHVFTWDDHEIRDGWGSRGARDVLDEAPLLQVARDVAEEYILGGGPRVATTRDKDAHQTLIQAPVAMFVFDSRSSRMYMDDERLPKTQVISDGQMADFSAFLDSVAGESTVKVLVLQVSVPVVAIARWAAKLGSNLPDWINKATGDLRDEVRDSWSAPENQPQLEMVINAVRSLVTRRPDIKLVLLSGDLHVSNAWSFQPPGFPSKCYQVTTSSLTNRQLGPSFLREIVDAPNEFQDPVLGQVNRIWKDITRPNALCMQTEGNSLVFTLRVNKPRMQRCSCCSDLDRELTVSF